MALLRNLRNLVNAGIPRDQLKVVADKLTDPETVASSRQLPYRYYSALKALPDGAPAFLVDALADAMNVSADALPKFDGETVMLVDLSGSMLDRLSFKSEVTRLEAVAPLAGALARQGGTETWCFSNGHRRVAIPKGTPVLAAMQMISRAVPHGGTYLEACLDTALTKPVDRVIILTDEQAHDNPGSALVAYLDRNPQCRAYIVNVAGDQYRAFAKHPRILQAGGFSDNVLTWISALEKEDAVEAVMAYAWENER
jgi:hypothetical protein